MNSLYHFIGFVQLYPTISKEDLSCGREFLLSCKEGRNFQSIRMICIIYVDIYVCVYIEIHAENPIGQQQCNGLLVSLDQLWAPTFVCEWGSSCQKEKLASDQVSMVG